MRAMRTCPECGLLKESSEFYPSRRTCKTCVSAYNREYNIRNRDVVLARKRQYQADNPDKVKASQAKWRGRRTDYNRSYKLAAAYGLVAGEYEALLAQQGDVCAICKKPPQGRRPLHVDHDHACCPTARKTCGRCVRGLLCNHCNRGLGAFMDDEDLLVAAVDYLKRTGG
jgi:transposase